MTGNDFDTVHVSKIKEKLCILMSHHFPLPWSATRSWKLSFMELVLVIPYAIVTDRSSYDKGRLAWEINVMWSVIRYISLG